MKTTRTFAALAAVAAIAVPVAGCGEDQSFIDDYNEATKPLQDLSKDIGTSLNSASSQSDEQVAAQFDKLANTSAEVNKNLAELDPPEDAKAGFDDLKAALTKGQKDLEAIAEAAKTGDVKAAQTAVAELGKDSKAISKAETEVKSKVED